ncbi:15629_t:CDS:1, partial [Dentiscutata heterogama]
VLLETFNIWMIELDYQDSELNVQIKNSKTENNIFTQSQKQSKASYTSRLFNISNLPKFDSLPQLPTILISNLMKLS